jgi:agmatinase
MRANEGGPGDCAEGVRPGWAGVSTLFGAPMAARSEFGSAALVAAGVPFDATATSRPGAAEGPEAIRRASRAYASWVRSLGSVGMVDMRTGQEFRYVAPPLLDAGDLPVFPTDPQRHFESVAAGARAIAEAAPSAIFMGGDHSVSYPLFTGVSEAVAGRIGKLAYVQVDHHFDFGRSSAIYGPLYHGSNARRISELPGVSPSQMAFIGVGDVTRRDQLEELRAGGYAIVTAGEIARQGASAAIGSILERLAACDGLYVSVDIDVLDGAEAPGTGNVTTGGLRVTDLQDIAAALWRLPVVALDVVEVAPRYDPTGRTAQIAARLLFELTHRQPIPCRDR